MTRAVPSELPPAKRALHDRAARLEWITIVYLISAIVGIYLTLGSSQAMKAAWLEDLLSLLPPIAFLVASRVRDRPHSEAFPYGFHRAVSIAFLCASLALFAMGLFIFYDSLMKLISFEHPSIGVVQPWGEPIWLGWFMIPALLWSAIPAAIIGRLKLPLARDLHDKVLFADAEMNKADWLTAGAALLGVLGIGIGWWWADGVAAIIISIDVTRDGSKNLRNAVKDLMDSSPTTVTHDAADPLPARVETELKAMPWIADARVRMREDGHVFFGEAFVVPSDERSLVSRIGQARDEILAIDWRLHDLVISVVADLTEADAPEKG